MKKILKIATALVMSAFVLPCSAFAQTSIITMNGLFTDKDAIGVTVLVADKDAQLTSLSPNQIFYVNQFPINSDGSFSMKLPTFSEASYRLYSNANNYNLYSPQEKLTLYVSSNGSDTANSGESESEPFKTLERAFSLVEFTKEIIIMDSMGFNTDIPYNYEGDLTIKGIEGDPKIELTLPSTVNLKGNLTLSNLTTKGISTIYANGYKLKIDETVTSDTTNRITVYGGTNGVAYTGDTNIELLGGYYAAVYGGSKDAVVTGSTNVIFGGNANVGDGINDAANAVPPISPCDIYGGGHGSTANVTEETNVTLKDNAVVHMIFGANAGTSNTPKVINVNIAGGKGMNIYGGAKGNSLNGCDINVTMTGGLVEAIFGGCHVASMTGNVYVNLEGGIVARRVYTGCYNNYSSRTLSWDSSHTVNGTTTLSISPNVTLNATDNIKNPENQINIGVFAGSRTKNNTAEEVNTIIFLDNCYNSKNSAIGKQDRLTSITLPNSHTDYTVKAGSGGKVLGTSTGGTVYIAPDAGKYGILNGSGEYVNANASFTGKGPHTVEFKDYDFRINSVVANTSDTNVSADVNLTANNTSNKINPTALVSIYDENNVFISCSIAENISGTNNYNFDLNCKLEAGKTYTVKAMIWDETMVPLVNVYSITVQK